MVAPLWNFRDITDLNSFLRSSDDLNPPGPFQHGCSSEGSRTSLSDLLRDAFSCRIHHIS